MSEEKTESSEEVNKTFQWYLEKPEIKDATPTKDFLQLPKLRWNPFTYSFSVGKRSSAPLLIRTHKTNEFEYP